MCSSSTLDKSLLGRRLQDGVQLEPGGLQLLLLGAVRPVQGTLLADDLHEDEEPDHDEDEDDGGEWGEHQQQDRVLLHLLCEDLQRPSDGRYTRKDGRRSEIICKASMHVKEKYSYTVIQNE